MLNKSCQKFSKSFQKSNHTSFFWKMMFTKRLKSHHTFRLLLKEKFDTQNFRKSPNLVTLMVVLPPSKMQFCNREIERPIHSFLVLIRLMPSWWAAVAAMYLLGYLISLLPSIDCYHPKERWPFLLLPHGCPVWPDWFYSFHYLSIYCREKLLNCIQNLPKLATIFAKY